MNIYQMGAIEARFADIVWQSEPISSAVLCKTAEKEFGWKKSTTYTVLKRLCEGEFGWKRTTTYTVLKRLSDGGLFRNEGGIVTALISKEDFYAMHSEMVVKESFGGSLPAFIAAFTAKNNLTREQIAELREMIDKFEEE